MKKIISLSLLALSLCATARPIYVKVMSYNIRNGNGIDDICNIQRTANVITSVKPNIVALQEVDSMTARSGHKYVLGELAERTNMHPFFTPAIDYDGGKYGIGLLSREKPLSVRTVALPGREEARTLFVADFPLYTFVGTHLSLTQEDRMASLNIIKAITDTCSKPVFVAGDLNDTPKSQFINAMSQEYVALSPTDKFTYPADKPTETIDYIFTPKEKAHLLTTEWAKVVDDKVASDHRPVAVRLRLATDNEKIMLGEPYLQNPSANAISVMWQTNVPTQNWIDFGTDTLNTKRARTLIHGQELCNNKMHKIRLDSLTPGKKYYYRVNSREILKYQGYYKAFGHTYTSPWYEFTLPSPNSNEFTALIFNDLHQHKETFKALMKQVKDVKYDFVVMNGDILDDIHTAKQATNFLNIIIEGVDGAEHPIFFLRGNHEIRDAYSIEMHQHFDYPNGLTYGAISWGDTRLVMLDCGEDKVDSHPVYYGLNDFSKLRQDQVDFMKKEFASKEFKKAKKRVLIHHIPMWGNYEPNLCFELWEPLLRKAPFDISINAHTHEFDYLPKGKSGNPFPVIVGGGYQMDAGTVMILRKNAQGINIRVINTSGKELLNLDV
jgi:Metal-dependent hydrolase